MKINDKRRVIATIDVGSNVLKMIVAEVTSKGEIIPLEELKKSTHIGRDTFATGKIDTETIHQTCVALNNFVRVMELYQVEDYRAVTTSGIREAKNRDYILEQIRLQTGLKVEVINNAEERFLTFKAIRDQIPNHQRFREEGTLIVDIGSGGVEISTYKDGYLKFTEYMKLGAMRIREQMSQLERISLDFPDLMEEFIKSQILATKPYIEKLQIKHFIGLGGELQIIYQLCCNGDLRKENKFIQREGLEKLYATLRTMTTEQIRDQYQLDYKIAELLIPSLIIFKTFFQMTGAQIMYIPMVSLRHGLLADLVDQWFNTRRKQDFINDIISSVWYIGQKYRVTTAHCKHVVQLALSIFDQLHENHGLTWKGRLYLQVAAILHDVGKYINSNQHAMNSYNIISSLDIIGFSDREIKLVANIARYHAEENPEPFHVNYQQMSYWDRILISKLAAILKLAEALDISHRQKIYQVEVILEEGELQLLVSHNEDILLEQWYFANKVEFFQEVLGIKLVLKSKG